MIFNEIVGFCRNSYRVLPGNFSRQAGRFHPSKSREFTRIPALFVKASFSQLLVFHNPLFPVTTYLTLLISI